MSTTEDFRDLSDDSLPLPEMNPPIAASLHDAEFISALGVIAGTENVDQVLLAKFLPHIRQLLEMTTVSAIQSRDVFDYQEIRASGGESGYCMGLLVALYPSCYGVTTRDSAKVLYPEQIIAIERANWAHDRQVDFSLKNLLEALFWLSRVPEAQHLPAILGAAHSTLSMTGLTRLVPWNAIGAFVINIILNIILIPNYGMIGAAWATLISLFVISLLRVLEVRWILKLTFFSTKMIKPILAGSITWWCLWRIHPIVMDYHTLVTLSAVSLISFLVYGIVLWVMRFESEDWDFLTGLGILKNSLKK